MELQQVLATDSGGRVIIVDDYFAPPEANSLDANALTDLFKHIGKAAKHRRKLAELLEQESRTKADKLMTLVEPAIKRLWQAYQDDPSSRDCLAPLFSAIELHRGGDKEALEAIATYCRDQLKLTPRTFPSLEAASEALKECSIAFVDFRFKGGGTVDRVIAAHSQFRESYGWRHEVDGNKVPKIVYLISSQLPRQDNLEAFRSATGLRAAFFSTMRKSDISAERLDAEIKRWRSKYPATYKLDTYLSEMSSAVDAAARSLQSQLDSLELHELAILNAFKLAVEHESLQDYLTWLLSEALASRLRITPALQPSLLPEESDLPVDGKIKSGALLFQLFSQIAISPISQNAAKPAFGDVYAIVPRRGVAAAAGREVLLAITPACDLQRCSAEDTVLCVRGKETETKADMQDLLNKGVLFGQGSHVIQYGDGEQSKYGYLAWSKKSLSTVTVKDLSSRRKYVKVARLSELFAQEVKEYVLSDVSRIGLPVYPSFCVSTQALVRMKFGDVVFQKDVSAESFECAVVIKGRRDPEQSKDGTFLAFTEQFIDWMRTEFLQDAKEQFVGQAPTKFGNVEKHLTQWTKDFHIELNSNKTRNDLDGALVFKLVEELTDGNAVNNTVEIIVAAKQPVR